MRMHLISLVTRACEVKSASFNSTDAKELLSRVIIRLVSPDSIAAKTQWHDPITHERSDVVLEYALSMIWFTIIYPHAGRVR